LTALALFVLGVILTGCDRDIDVVSRSVITGSVNAGTVEGRVSATFNTRRGGRSSCEFERLPAGFTPGTFGTHA